MSSQANIYIDKGTDFRLTIELFDGDGDDLSLAYTTFHGDMRKLYSTKKAAEFEIEKANNDITLVMSSDITSALDPGKYQYDVLMRKVDLQGQVVEISKIVEGIAFVVSTITEV